MAIEHYAFEVGEFEAVPSDPRKFEAIIWKDVFRRWPMIETMRDGRTETPAMRKFRPTLVYRITGVYAEPETIDVWVFLMVYDKDTAAAIKLIIG